VNLVDNQTTEQSAREYRFLSKAIGPVREVILAENLRKGQRVHEGSKVNVTNMWDYEGRRWEKEVCGGETKEVKTAGKEISYGD